VTSLPLFDRPTFDGDTFDPFLDGVRLESQLSLVAQVMSDGAWWTIPAVVVEIVRRFGVKCSDTGHQRELRLEAHAVEERVEGVAVEGRAVEEGEGCHDAALAFSAATMRPATVRDGRSRLPADTHR
jgi:hypothetical protein